jgi:N-ethylmaleimide reductase
MKLFESVQIGHSVLKNRIATAPMTRSGAGMDGVVGPSTVVYFTQRATAGLIFIILC